MKKLFFFLALISLATFSNSQTIVVDADNSDWSAVPMLSEPGVFPYAKAYVTTDSLYYMMEVNDAAANHFHTDPNVVDFLQAYIDADSNSATGHKSGWLYTTAGIDYLTNNIIYYFDGADQSAWNFVWNWVPIGVSRNLTIGEVGVLKSAMTTISGQAVASQIPLATNFRIGFTYKATDGVETQLQANDYNFANRNMYSVKPRTTVQLGISASLLSSNAFYHPFMNDADIDSYLDFQSAAWAAQNPLHWAAWAIDVNSAVVYDMTFTRKCTDGGKVEISLVDMASNEVVKTFPEVWYTASAAAFAEESLGELDLTDVPTGKYMLKLKNNTGWDSFLKVQQLTLTSTVTGNVSPRVWSRTNLSTNANSIVLQSDKACDMAIYNTAGVLLAERKNTSYTSIELKKGLYLVLISLDGQTKIQKILL